MKLEWTCTRTTRRSDTGFLFLSLVLAFSLCVDSAAGQVRREMRVYDLRFLAQEDTVNAITPSRPILRCVWGYREGPLVNLEEEVTLGAPGAEDVLLLMEQMIAPESWSNERNSIDMEGPRLVVIQEPPVLDQIDGFLSLLEAAAGRALVIDLALVPPRVLVPPGDDEDDAEDSPWMEPAAFERAVAAAGKRALFLSATAAEGRLAVLQPADISIMLDDYDVNQTGVIPVLNPVVTAHPSGAFAEVIAHSSPSGSWFRVGVRLGQTSSRERAQQRQIHGGDIDLPRSARREVSTSVVVPRGKAAILGYFSAAHAGAPPDDSPPVAEFAALLRVRETPMVRAKGKVEGLPQIVPVGVLLGRVRESAYVTHDDGEEPISFEEEDEELLPENLEPEKLLELLSARFPSKGGLQRESERFALARGRLFVRTVKPAKEVTDYLERLALQPWKPVSVELRQGVVSAATLKEKASSGVIMDAKWLKEVTDRQSVRCRLVGLDGHQSSLASVATSSYVADLEMVSGGTGFDIKNVADPVVGVTGAGLLLDATCTLIPGTPLAQLRVRGRYARPPTFGRKVKSRVNLKGEVEIVSDAGNGSREGRVIPTTEWIDLELPDEDLDRWEHEISVPLGKPVLLNALPDPSNPGKTRILVALVRAYSLGEAPKGR